MRLVATVVLAAILVILTTASGYSQQASASLSATDTGSDLNLNPCLRTLPPDGLQDIPDFVCDSHNKIVGRVNGIGDLLRRMGGTIYHMQYTRNGFFGMPGLLFTNTTCTPPAFIQVGFLNNNQPDVNLPEFASFDSVGKLTGTPGIVAGAGPVSVITALSGNNGTDICGQISGGSKIVAQSAVLIDTSVFVPPFTLK